MKRFGMTGTVFLAQPLLSLLLIPALSGLAPQAAQEGMGRPAGRWEGTLTLPSSAALEFSLELWRNDQQWEGVISIPAQNLKRFPLASVELEGDSLSFALPGISGDPTFTGTLSDEGLKAAGALKQGGIEMPFQMQWKGEASPPEKPAALDAKAAEVFLGSWQGTLDTPAGSLRMRFHLKAGPDGKLTAALDSPDQRQTGLPVSRIEVDGRKLRLFMDYMDGVFEGELSEDGGRIEGAWKQRGAEFPLVLEPYSDSSGNGG